MIKNRYEATFPLGVKITRTSMHEYAYAWAVFGPDGRIFTRYSGMKGFSANAILARAALSDALNRARTSGVENLTGIMVDAVKGPVVGKPTLADMEAKLSRQTAPGSRTSGRAMQRTREAIIKRKFDMGL